MYDFTPIIIWSLVIGAGLSVIVTVMSLFAKSKKSTRINNAVSKKRAELGKQQMETLTKTSGIRQNTKKTRTIDILEKILKLINLKDMLASKELRTKLMQAGLRGQTAVISYVASRFIIGLVAIFGVFTYVNLMPEFKYPEFMKYVFSIMGGGAGFMLPQILLSNNIAKRQDGMTKAFPDTLDLLVICVEAGLSVENALSRVTEEIAEASEVLAYELGLTSAELAYLGDRRQAYDNFAKRTGLPAAKALATTLIQSEQYGTPVGVALKVLSQEKRDERMSAAEQKAAALPAKLTVPMIIFFLPVLFVVVIGPAAIRIIAM